VSAALDVALRALADQNRRRILEVVRDEPRSVGEIASATSLSQQTTSHHLRVLREAHLLQEQREGTRHLFVVRHDGFAAVEAYLSSFWPDRLQRLKIAAETEAAERRRRG
jgi:DNA-binding transcriptional ArsR family regulator